MIGEDNVVVCMWVPLGQSVTNLGGVQSLCQPLKTRPPTITILLQIGHLILTASKDKIAQLEKFLPGRTCSQYFHILFLGVTNISHNRYSSHFEIWIIFGDLLKNL